MDLITVLLIAFGGFTALYAAGWIVVSWTESQRHNMPGGTKVDPARDPAGRREWLRRGNAPAHTKDWQA